MATPPPSPPSPPKGDGTPDGGNPAHAAPPKVEPKPGEAGAATPSRGGSRKAGAADRASPKPGKRSAAKASKPARAAAKPPAQPRKSTAPRPAAPRAAGRPRVRPGPSIATVPTTQPTDVTATDPIARSRGNWWKAIAGGLGAIAAGAALFSLRGSSRRKAHQADGTDSSKSFKAGIADEGTIPDEPATP